jgi:hypothetical protein
MPEDTKTTGTEMDADGKSPELDAKETYSAEEVQNLLSALKSERSARKAQDKALKEAGTKLATLEQINPEEYQKLQEAAARRAEFEAEYQAKDSQRAKQLEEIQSTAAQREQSLQREIATMREHRAFERLFTSKAVGGKGGRFLDMAFDQLRGSLRLEGDGSFTVLDGSGDPLLDSETGKRVEPSSFLSRYKSDEFLGFAFEPEQGYGGGAFPAGPGRRDTGNPVHDLKGLSTDEIFARTFGRR